MTTGAFAAMAMATAMALALSCRARGEGATTDRAAASSSSAAITAGAVDAQPPTRSAPDAPPGMALVPGGTFVMGTADGAGYEGPPHHVTVRAFFLDAHETTNDDFIAFVAATKHVTRPERDGESQVFVTSRHEWDVVRGADFRHPEGPSSSIKSRGRHPVVHVAWDDAVAYCAWAGKRLPTEAEWERAAGAGHDGARFPWGDAPAVDADADAAPRANTWQGPFPDADLGRDGFRSTAPVGSFAPNALGLFDMAGNVWEWTADVFDAHAYDHAEGAVDPRGPAQGAERVIRGGSWLCSPDRCIGYRVAARAKAVAAEGTNHVGLRCARSIP